jgi:hypothetical protein
MAAGLISFVKPSEQEQSEMHYNNLANYLWHAAVSTFSQLVILLGPGLSLAFVMHLLAGFIADKSCTIIGRNAFLALFGWLGTIIHEGGHVVFCLLFGHRITAVKWFDFNCNDGSLGYVRHSYDRNSLYQRIGHFFIGIGPILLGTAAIYYASRYLLGPEFFASLRHGADSAMLISKHSFASLAKSVSHGFVTIYSEIFTGKNLTNWKFYFFLYLTFSVGSSIRLSPADIKGASSGFIALAGMLLVFNVATNWLGIVPERVFRGLSNSCSIFYVAMVFAILVNAIVAAVLLLLTVPHGNRGGS